MKTLTLDDVIGIGWGPFKLSDEHPFYQAAVVHDAAYEDILTGVSERTLKQHDKIFRNNCLRIAAREGWRLKDPGEFAKLAREAWLFYRIVRLWATLFRRDFEAWRPGQGPLEGGNK